MVPNNMNITIVLISLLIGVAGVYVNYLALNGIINDIYDKNRSISKSTLTGLGYLMYFIGLFCLALFELYVLNFCINYSVTELIKNDALSIIIFLWISALIIRYAFYTSTISIYESICSNLKVLNWAYHYTLRSLLFISYIAISYTICVFIPTAIVFTLLQLG
jgi:hypothetical protein